MTGHSIINPNDGNKDIDESPERAIWMGMSRKGYPFLSVGKSRPSSEISQMDFHIPFLIVNPNESIKFLINTSDLIQIAMGVHSSSQKIKEMRKNDKKLKKIQKKERKKLN